MNKQTIRELRTAAGLTQKQLAERVGVTANTVARWERGMVTVGTVATLQALADALGVQLNEIELPKRKPTRPRSDES